MAAPTVFVGNKCFPVDVHYLKDILDTLGNKLPASLARKYIFFMLFLFVFLLTLNIKYQLHEIKFHS